MVPVKKMNEFDLTEAQKKRLFLLVREMGDVQRIVRQIALHGYSELTRAQLERELGDMMTTLVLLWSAGDVSEMEVKKRFKNREKELELEIERMKNGME